MKNFVLCGSGHCGLRIGMAAKQSIQSGQLVNITDLLVEI